MLVIIKLIHLKHWTRPYVCICKNDSEITMKTVPESKCPGPHARQWFWHGLFVSVSAFFFFLQRFQTVEEKKPHWFEMTSTLYHLYSVMLPSKEINLSVFFSPQRRVQKGRARSPFASVLNLLLVNSLWTFPFFTLIFIKKTLWVTISPRNQNHG